MYFSSAEEAREKLAFYLRNDAARRRIAAAGYARCLVTSHSGPVCRR
jgi:spore maturation protein CgeB